GTDVLSQLLDIELRKSIFGLCQRIILCGRTYFNFENMTRSRKRVLGGEFQGLFGPGKLPGATAFGAKRTAECHRDGSRRLLSAITARTPSSRVPFAAQSREEPAPYSLPASTTSGTPASRYLTAAS